MIGTQKKEKNLYNLVTTWDKFIEAQDYLYNLGTKPRLAIDTETCGKAGLPIELKPALRHDNVLLGVSISRNETSGFYIPYFINPSYKTIWNKEQFFKIRNWLKSLFLDKNIGWVMHNSIFDLRVLKRNIARPRNLVFDTIIAAHELNENRPLGLKPLAVTLFGDDMDAEKRDMLNYAKDYPDLFGTSKPSNDIMMGQLWKFPLELYGNYAIKDTILTYKLYNQFKKDLIKNSLVKRYILKHKLIPVYEEINNTGWAIDEEVLLNNGKLIKKEILEYYDILYTSLKEYIVECETETLKKVIPIKKTNSWLKKVIALEKLEDYFTVKYVESFYKNGKQKPVPSNVGAFITDKKMVAKFLQNSSSSNTLTKEFIEWDGLLFEDLSEPLRYELLAIQRERTINNRYKNIKNKDKIKSNYAFNFNSDTQIQTLLFDKLALPILKRTKKTDSPDVSSDVLYKLVLELCKRLKLDNKVWVNKENYNTKLQILKEYIKGNATIDNKIFTNTSLSTKVWDNIRALLFIDVLQLLRDHEKVYNTYIIGIAKRLYTHLDLNRKPQINEATGNIVKYCISSVSLVGCVTGRASSSNPSQLNIPSIESVKSAFVAPKGYYIGSADYDGQEVRQACHIARDSDLREVFNIKCEHCGEPQSKEIRKLLTIDVYNTLLEQKDKDTGIVTKEVDDRVKCPECGKFKWSSPDPHSLNAKRIYSELENLSLREIKSKHSDKRSIAKTVQFQTLYGGSGLALGQKLNISTDEASAIQAKYFKASPMLKKAMDKTVRDAKDIGYVETIGGYRRYLPDLQLKSPPRGAYVKLDKEVLKAGCFGKVDLHPEINSEGKVTKSLSATHCPREYSCEYFEQCEYEFRRRNTGKLRARAERQAFNCAVQGGSCDITNAALLNILTLRSKLSKLNPEWSKVKIISSIYDAIYLYIPETLVPTDTVNTPLKDNYIKVLSYCMENTYENLYVDMTAEIEKPVKRWCDAH